MGAMVVEGDGGPRVPLSQFVRQCSRFVSQVTDEPVTLTKNGSPVAVLVNFQEFRKMAEVEERLEDLYWTVVAMRADLEWRRSGGKTVPLAEAEERARGGN